MYQNDKPEFETVKILGCCHSLQGDVENPWETLKTIDLSQFAHFIPLYDFTQDYPCSCTLQGQIQGKPNLVTSYNRVWQLGNDGICANMFAKVAYI